MAIRNVFPIGEPVLRKKAKQVEVFDERLHALIDDMWDTLRKEEGAGLAANQVGVLKRVCLVSFRGQDFELVNPVILEKSKETAIEDEGCLSVKDKQGRCLYDKVERPVKVKVKAQDRFGKFFTRTFEGWLARAVCHETDHLDGILYVDLVKKGK